jgi:hypothetical protein
VMVAKDRGPALLARTPVIRNASENELHYEDNHQDYHQHG